MDRRGGMKLPRLFYFHKFNLVSNAEFGSSGGTERYYPMMKNLLCMIIMSAFPMTMLADSKVILKSGDASVLSSAANAFIEFDYSKAKIEGKDTPLEDFIEQKGAKYELKWEQAQEMSHKDFIKRFNKKSTGLKLSADSTKESKFKVVISIRTINMGNTAKSLLPIGSKTEGGTTLFGRIYVKDLKGRILCELRFIDIKGLGAPAIQARLLFAYQELNTTIHKFLKKSKKSNEEEEEEKDEKE